MRERGAVLALVGLTLMVVLVSGAIAVDISSLDRQGQVLQNTADAAALAAVATWVDTGDTSAATAIVSDMVRQNGVEVGDDVRLDVSFPTASEVRVDLVDAAPDVFLGGVVGLGGELGRDATARFDECESGCNRRLELPPPFTPVRAVGSGDGFVPVLVGNRMYGVNHHSSTMSCVDRQTLAQCWSSQPLFYGNKSTTDNHNASAVGDLIYYTGYGNSTSVLMCWNTAIDSRCGSEVSMGNNGWSTIMVAPDDRIFVFTATRKVFCFVAVTHQSCAGYGGGRDTAPASVSSWVENNRSSVWKSYVVFNDGKIYHSMASNGQMFLHCWDTGSGQPCAGFGVLSLNGTRPNTGDYSTAGRLFFNRDAAGEPLSICSIGWNDVECRDLDGGGRISSHETKFASFHESMTEQWWRGWASTNSYHVPSNRLFAVNSNRSITYCFDFVTSTDCGSAYNSSPSFGEIQTYGYVGDGNCLIGLGDNSIFFSMKPDMTGECEASNGTLDITPCRCDGLAEWPPVEGQNVDDLQELGVRVLSPDGELLIPSDGSQWFDMLGGVLELDSVDTSLPYVQVEITALAKPGRDPWAGGGEVPVFLVGIEDEGPRLTE